MAGHLTPRRPASLTLTALTLAPAKNTLLMVGLRARRAVLKHTDGIPLCTSNPVTTLTPLLLPPIRHKPRHRTQRSRSHTAILTRMQPAGRQYTANRLRKAIRHRMVRLRNHKATRLRPRSSNRPIPAPRQGLNLALNPASLAPKWVSLYLRLQWNRRWPRCGHSLAQAPS